MSQHMSQHQNTTKNIQQTTHVMTKPRHSYRFFTAAHNFALKICQIFVNAALVI